MTDWIRTWLLGIVAAAAAASLAECLVSQRAIRRVARLAGGVLMVLAMLRPLGSLSPAELPLSYPAYREEIDALTERYQAEQNSTLSALIAEETAAYIVDKAAALGLETEAEVRVAPDGEGVPLPREVRLTIPRDSALSDWLAEELGIPAEAQYWQEA